MKKYKVTVNGTAYEIELEEIDAQTAVQEKEEKEAQNEPAKEEPKEETAAKGEGTNVTSPMPGNILDIKVKVGDTVNKGDVLMILEAMKMENEIPANCDGTVKEISVSKGNAVETGSVLCVIG